MRRQVPDRLLVAGLSFVIREKRRVGLFFFLPSLSSVLWLKAVSWYRQTEVMGQTRTHAHTNACTDTHLMGQV